MEITKSKWIINIALLLLLFALFFLMNDNVSAAGSESTTAASEPQELSKLKKTPFVKKGRTLVLRFADFSSNGYTYTVMNTKSSKKIHGSLRSGKQVLTVNLKKRGILSDNTGYVMEIVSRDKTKKVTTRFFTGKALSDIVITQKPDHNLAYTWKLSATNVYSGFLAMASKEAEPVQPELHTFASNGSAEFSSAKLSAGTWYCSGIAYKVIGDYRYYGERVIKKITYNKNVQKVTGLKVTEGAQSAVLTWNKVDGASWYMIYIKSKGKKYRLVANNVKATSYKVTGLKNEKKYTFSVRAVQADSGLVRMSSLSNEDTVETPKAAADIRKIAPAFNSKNELSVKWKKVKGASSYRVYYRKAGEGDFKFLGKTKKYIFSLSKLDQNTKYEIKAYTVSKDHGTTYVSPEGSNVIKLTPAEYVKKHYTKLLATKVRTIGYHKGSCEYTKKKYSNEVKLAYINCKKYSSKTKYLIWISHYTQQVTIFKGSTGNWKIIRSFTVGTGKASTRSPRGIFKIFRKESGWYYNYSKELYISHYAGRNSFHTRPLYNNGSVASPGIGRPVSHGCVRCYNQDARFIYKKIPIGTTVVSY